MIKGGVPPGGIARASVEPGRALAIYLRNEVIDRRPRAVEETVRDLRTHLHPRRQPSHSAHESRGS